MLIYLFIFIFGTIIGSFLNVVILRHNTGMSIVKGDSACFSCGGKLKWHQLIPIISFIVQKGRCKNCDSKISWQYPLVETTTGLLFLLVTWKSSFQVHLETGFPSATVYYLTIFSILIAISVYDIKHQIIPDRFVYLFIALSAFTGFFQSGNLFSLDSFLAGILSFSFFAGIWLLSKGRAMGFGDAKLALGIGLLLGLSGSLTAILYSFWIGAIVGISLLIFHGTRYNKKSKIPFGPFLALGAIIVFLVGDNNIILSIVNGLY